jgi:hypothetical protein
MSQSRHAFFPAKLAAFLAAATIAIAVPLVATTSASADNTPPPPPPVNTTDGHGWTD